MPVYPGALNLQMVAASGFAASTRLEYPYDPPGWTPEGRDAMLEQPFTHERGALTVPDTPGLGVTIDRRALRRYGTRFFMMDRKRLMLFALRDRGLRTAREMDAAKRSRLTRGEPPSR